MTRIALQGTYVTSEVLSDDFVDFFKCVGGRLAVQDLHGVDKLDGQKVLKGSNVLSYFYVDAPVEAAQLKYSISRLLMGLAALLAVLLARLVPFAEV